VVEGCDVVVDRNQLFRFSANRSGYDPSEMISAPAPWTSGREKAMLADSELEVARSA
jgi:hypothetical protein